jgi:hypothetical protein
LPWINSLHFFFQLEVVVVVISFRAIFAIIVVTVVAVIFFTPITLIGFYNTH